MLNKVKQLHKHIQNFSVTSNLCDNSYFSVNAI